MNAERSIEEIAYKQGYIDAAQLERLAAPMLKNQYGRYLMELLEEKHAVG